jgi:hypothetical protein
MVAASSLVRVVVGVYVFGDWKSPVAAVVVTEVAKERYKTPELPATRVS